MRYGHVCAAGLAADGTAHVRPVLSGARRLPGTLLARHGGVLEIGQVVDLGDATPVPTVPAVEDVEIDERSLRAIGRARKDWWLRRIEEVARAAFADVFGSALRPCGQTLALDEGEGVASLGCLRPVRPPAIGISPRGVRINVAAEDHEVWLNLNDVRCYAPDLVTPDRRTIDSWQERVRREPVVIGVGVSRAWQPPGDRVARHWLQANSLIFLEDRS